jgi:hypothetical protein
MGLPHDRAPVYLLTTAVLSCSSLCSHILLLGTRPSCCLCWDFCLEPSPTSFSSLSARIQLQLNAPGWARSCVLWTHSTVCKSLPLYILFILASQSISFMRTWNQNTEIVSQFFYNDKKAKKKPQTMKRWNISQFDLAISCARKPGSIPTFRFYEILKYPYNEVFIFA